MFCGIVGLMATRKADAEGIVGWEPYKFKVLMNGKERYGAQITGNVPQKDLFGNSSWEKSPEEMKRKYIFSTADIAAFELAFEAEADGNCAECLNERRVFASWNHETGTQYKLCPKCSKE